MRTRQIGSVAVGAIGLGGMPMSIEGRPDSERSVRTIHAALDAGLSGPSRLHDLFVAQEAVTPGEARRRGEGLTLTFGWAPTPFGPGLLAMAPRGLAGEFAGAILSIDPRGPQPLVVPRDFAAHGGQAATRAGSLRIAQAD